MKYYIAFTKDKKTNFYTIEEGIEPTSLEDAEKIDDEMIFLNADTSQLDNKIWKLIEMIKRIQHG